MCALPDREVCVMDSRVDVSSDTPRSTMVAASIPSITFATASTLAKLAAQIVIVIV